MDIKWLSETIWMGIIGLLAIVLLVQIGCLIWTAPSLAAISALHAMGFVFIFLVASFVLGCLIRLPVYLRNKSSVNKPELPPTDLPKV